MSLREVMIATAILAAYAAVIAYIGWQSLFLWICVVCSLILTASFVSRLPARQQEQSRGIGLWFVIGGIAVFTSGFMMSIAVLLNCLMHALLLMMSKTVRPLSAKQILFASSLLTLISFAVAISAGIPGYQKLLDARARFIPDSPRQRLTYEQPHVSQSKVVPELSADWEYFESQHRRGGQQFMARNYNLKGLHSRSVESFIKSQGFGVGRMIHPNPYRVRTPELYDLPFSSAEGEFHSGPFNYYFHDPVNDGVWGGAPVGFHFQRLYDFANPQSLGVKYEDDLRIGFLPHAFHVIPAQLNHADKLWELTELQLVSLLRFDKPRVYVLNHLPRMDQLEAEDVETRALSAFELESLDKVRDGEVITTQVAGDRLSAFGSIVASQTCLECHQVERGEMLGAFTYQFRLANLDAND